MTYNNHVEDAFKVNTRELVVKFMHSPEGLYFYNISYDYLNKLKSTETQLIMTMAKNHSNHSTQQYARAKATRKLYQNICTSMEENFKLIIK